MTSRILLATILLGFFLSISSAVIPVQKRTIKPIDFSNPEAFSDKTNITSDDSVSLLLYVVDSLAHKTQQNVEQIKENNKIIKNYEMETSITRNP
jgi:hypothetical protein